MDVDVSKWSGEGDFTQVLVDRLKAIEHIRFIRVEDAPATRSEADYHFLSNEIFVSFATRERKEPTKRFGFLPAVRVVSEKVMTLGALEAELTGSSEIGAPDYSDDAMMQYLRAERVVPPYQTRGYKMVELVRIYEAVVAPAGAR